MVLRYWWHKAGMNGRVDAGYTVEQVSRRVNGGTNGQARTVHCGFGAVQCSLCVYVCMCVCVCVCFVFVFVCTLHIRFVCPLASIMQTLWCAYYCL